MNETTQRRKQFWLLVPAVLLAVVWAASPFFISQASEEAPFHNSSVTTFLQASLSGSPIGSAMPFGRAEYKVYTNNTRKLEVNVFSVNLPAGTQLTVLVNNASVGQLTVSPFRSGRLELRTDRGQTVPTVQAGQTIAVRQQNATTNVLSGSFTTVAVPSPTASGSPRPSVSPSPRPSVSPSPRPPARFFTARLSGGQVVPAVTTQARGEARILLNQAETEIQVFASFFNLSSAQTGASINGPALPGANAAQIFDLGTIGGTSGFLPIRTFPVTAAQVAQLRSGSWYVIVKSTNNPNGEIRGQVRAFGHRGDFEGDGLSDLAVFRPSEGKWYFLNSSNEEFRSQTLGSANDKIVSGDYDGDGVSDPAVFRNANGLGVWDVRRSGNDSISSEQWGLATDTPVSADFDGDGRVDLAVFRNGNWYIRKSSDNGFMAVTWGIAGDIPIPADFDGDGRADVAVFRPSTGAWFAYQSSDGSMFAVQWGAAGDIPQTGDFDGDGEADVAVFRPSNGVWYKRQSIDGSFDAVQFGMVGDIPVAGNFDTDYITDLAVFRPSTGTWFVNRTVDETISATQFGANGDRPAAGQ